MIFQDLGSTGWLTICEIRDGLGLGMDIMFQGFGSLGSFRVWEIRDG